MTRTVATNAQYDRRGHAADGCGRRWLTRVLADAGSGGATRVKAGRFVATPPVQLLAFPTISHWCAPRLCARLASNEANPGVSSLISLQHSLVKAIARPDPLPQQQQRDILRPQQRNPSHAGGQAARHGRARGRVHAHLLHGRVRRSAPGARLRVPACCRADMG